MVDLAAAYASCARDARTHYENFPVASLLLPRDMRQHVAAVYAFARAADDFADEGHAAGARAASAARRLAAPAAEAGSATRRAGPSALTGRAGAHASRSSSRSAPPFAS